MIGFPNAFPANKPEVFINFAANKFTTHGSLTGEPARDPIAKLPVALQDRTNKLRG
jgi:hypothetical protein